jgi:putative ABC transport system permease protein
MKYLPLVWAALARKPTRSILIFASAIIGFALFGLMAGVNAGFRHMADQARLDRLYVSSRYGGGLTLAQEQEIADLPGVAHTGHFDVLAGYVRQPGNGAAVLMASPGMRDVFPELALGAGWRQLDLVQDGIFLSRAEAARFHVQPGGRFSLLTTTPSRRDGSRLWSFEVLGLVDDISFFPAGFAVANYAYLDEARPLVERSRAGQVWLLVTDRARAEAMARAIEQRFANAPVPVRVDSEKYFFENLGGPDSDLARITEAIAAIGLVMIIFLTGNAMAQSVRERLHEFAVLKTIGFTDRSIVALLFAEAAIPCLLGGMLGLCGAAGLALVLPRFLPPSAQFPMPSLSPPFLALGMGAALLAVLVSTALPALRLARLDVATVLARK